MSSDQIVEDLAERIMRGQYKPGTQLPGYQQLMQLYSVGYTTIHSVVTRLKDRGLIIGRQGRGLFVPDVLPSAPEEDHFGVD
jgi:DNA-binding GntR family transcriptional regulator